MQLNWLVILATGLIPMLVGAVYYSKMLLGDAAQKAAGTEGMAMKHPALVYGVSLFLSLLMAVFMMPIVMHANHVFSLIMTPENMADANSMANQDAAAFFAKYGGNFRTFGHGVVHGLISAVFGVWPIVGIIGLFENRGWRWIAIHVGYFAICMTLMGGVICAYA